MEILKRYQLKGETSANTTNITSHSKCPKCGGVGFIKTVINGCDSLEECICTRQERIKYYLKSSGILFEEYQKKSLSTFIVDDEESKKMADIAFKFLKNESATGLGFFGKSGTGKTHLSIAVAKELTERRGLMHRYFSFRSEIQKLKTVFFNSEEYSKLMTQWQEVPILIIDDLLKFSKDAKGRVYPQELQIIFEIINSRYINRRVTIFTSEYSVDEIIKIDPALGSRIFEMIKPYGLKCDGKNRRLKHE